MTVTPLPAIPLSGQHAIQRLLDTFGETLPGCALTVANDQQVLFDSRSGKFDALEGGSEARLAAKDDIMWFASTTKLVTSVGKSFILTIVFDSCLISFGSTAYLQLVDRGILTLDTDLSQYYPALKEATSRVFRGVGEDGEPIWEEAATPVTLKMMLNQTSGFGMEFLSGVQGWKKYSGKGPGFVNSCKVVRLALYYC